MFVGGSRAHTDCASDLRFLLSSLRTAQNRKPSQFTRKLAGSAVAVAAFASGATATAVAESAGSPAAPHAADTTAGAAVQQAGASPAGQISPASAVGSAGPVSLVSPPRGSRGGLGRTADSRAAYTPAARAR